MHRRTLLTVLASTPFALGTLSAAWAQGVTQSGQPVGVADTVIGDASAILGGVTRNLANSDPILFDDLLRTGPASRIRVLFEDDTQLTLGENAQALIDRYVYDPAAGEGSILTQVLGGAFQFVSGAINTLENREIIVLTSHVTLGIRGTKFWAGFLEGRYEVFVFDGEVDIRNTDTAVTLRAGDGAAVETPFGQPSPVVQWSQDKIEQALATVSL